MKRFPVMGYFSVRVTAEMLGKANKIATEIQPSRDCDDEAMEDRVVSLLDAALDAVLQSGIPITPKIKLAVVPAEPKQRSAARGKRGGR